MSAPITTRERLYDVEAIASRIIVQGAYARVSHDEQRAMAEWIVLRLEAMRSCNDATVASAATPSPQVAAAITEVLAVCEQVIESVSRPRSMAGIASRVALYGQINTLKTRLEEELKHVQD